MFECFIIRVKENTISEFYSEQCIIQANKFGIQVKKFDAVNGHDYARHLSLLDLKPRYKFKKKRPGVFGCFLSHYYLWQYSIDKNVPLIILEHDGYFIRKIPENILNNFEDVLKLDRLDPFSNSYQELLTNEENLEIEYETYKHHSSKLIEKHGTGNYFKGAYSYMIKPNACLKIINWIKKNGFVPADQQIGDAIVNLKAIKPTIARLHPDYLNNIDRLSLTKNTNLL